MVRLGQHGVRSLWMRQDRYEPGALDKLAVAQGNVERASEGHFDQNGVEVAEPIAGRVLVKACRRGRYLEAELQVDPDGTSCRPHARVGTADGRLASRIEAVNRPHMRGCIDNARATFCRCANELETLVLRDNTVVA